MLLDIKEIRRKNLAIAIEKAGSAAKLSALTDISPSAISQMKSAKHSRNIGGNAAREIESALSLPHGWMDQLHGDNEQDSATLGIQANGLNNNTLQASLMTADEVELFACYKALKKDKKKLLLETARAFNKADNLY